ncbi:MAG: biotin--[acetyl-CoA-carboxylase] ligase [Candidatus Dormiibacterota bacterium]
MTESLDLAGLRKSLVNSPLRFELRGYSRVASTQDLALAAADSGAAEGLVILADEQLAGRGRAGRSWHSPPGTALMFSLLLWPEPSLADLSSLSLVAGLALVEGLALAEGPLAQLKWPNDCLCGDRKLAGVLAESRTYAEGRRALVLGLGCNVTWAGLAVPSELRRSATACDLEGHPVERTSLAEAVLKCLAQRYLEWTKGGFPAVRGEWLAHAAWLGEEVIAEHHLGQVRGRAAGVSDLGELLVDTKKGLLAIAAGDVAMAAPPQLRLVGEESE